MSAEAIVVAPGDGDVVPRPGTTDAITIKLPSRAADGAVTVFESIHSSEDSFEPGVHSHPGFDEILYVIAGVFEFTAGSRTILAEAGTVAFLPRGIFHRLRCTGKAAGSLLTVCIPGGIEDFFAEADPVPSRHIGVSNSDSDTHPPSGSPARSSDP